MVYKKIPPVLSEMYNCGEVSESQVFPLDIEHAGIILRLKNSADHMSRSKALFHPSVITKKKEDIWISIQDKTSKEMKEFQESMNKFEMKKDSETKLVKAMKEASENRVDKKLEHSRK